MDTPSTPPCEQDFGAEHLDEDRVLDLLLDLLPDREWQDATRHLALCPPCEDLVRQQGAELERLRAGQAPEALRSPAAARAGLEQWNQAREPVPAGATRENPAVGHVRRWLRAAARRPAYAFGFGGAILVTLALLLLIVKPGKNLPYPAAAAWLPSAAETLQLRDEAGRSSGEELASGLAAYDRRDLPAAIRSLSEAETSGALETVRRVFLGSALTQAGDFRHAVTVFRDASIESMPEPWRSETEWSYLIALHRAGFHARADSLLRVLAGESGEVGDRARRLLGRSNR